MVRIGEQVQKLEETIRVLVVQGKNTKSVVEDSSESRFV